VDGIQRDKTVEVNSNEFLFGSGTTHGIRIDRSDYGSRLQITANNFAGHNATNSSYAIFISNPTISYFGSYYFVNAKQNWWNSSGGPHDPGPPGLDGDYNANPSGDRVWDAVGYKPYATTKY
ncbi:MAG: hypothetical protein ACYTKD_26540, partial [Planctomycetota bacterium]|jgi:hypothetical protein